MALILITHDLGVVAGICDRVNVMYAGRIVEAADVDQAFLDSRHPYTLGLLNSIPRIDRPLGARLVPIEGMPPDLVAKPVGCSFAPRCTFRVERCGLEAPGLAPVVEGQAEHRAACWVDVRGRAPAAAVAGE
jgi:oligopeptide/dipeptide ABC transporter ATP-binding protein